MVEDVKQSIFTEDSIEFNIWECVDVLMFDFGLFDFIVDKFAYCFCKTPPLQEDCDQSVTTRILYKMCIKLSTLFMILLTSKRTAIYGFEFIPPAEEDLSSYMDVSIQSVEC